MTSQWYWENIMPLILLAAYRCKIHDHSNWERFFRHLDGGLRKIVEKENQDK
jgi:hypothetical protein